MRDWPMLLKHSYKRAGGWNRRVIRGFVQARMFGPSNGDWIGVDFVPSNGMHVLLSRIQPCQNVSYASGRWKHVPLARLSLGHGGSRCP